MAMNGQAEPGCRICAKHRGEHGWMASDRWPDAPRGSTADVVDLCRRLRPYLKPDD